METNSTERSKPVNDFKDSLYYLQRSHEEMARAKLDVEKTLEEAAKAFRSARHAAKEMNKSLPDRFMCGQWLFEFKENGSVAVTEIPNSEPYELINIARSMGETAE